MLALFDLDGFKQYNDTFGHPAGDALLQRLGGNLAAFLHGRGARLPDGRRRVLRAVPAAASRRADGARRGAALSEHGDGFSITCSYGAITLPLEAADAVEALRIADQRMYAQKHAGRSRPAARARTCCCARSPSATPGSARTPTRVAELADATAQPLGLTADEVEHVRHAAELHDVGKVAIPDAILGKPGPLTDEEWAFVRRHPMIGERIILAAPALARVATLVRSSHERWDGTGYPDRLAGEEIPLGARIVAVADAFAAMIADRPYRRPARPRRRSTSSAACAGTQFDPAVVDAWCAAYEQRTPAGVRPLTA